LKESWRHSRRRKWFIWRWKWEANCSRKRAYCSRNWYWFKWGHFRSRFWIRRTRKWRRKSDNLAYSSKTSFCEKGIKGDFNWWVKAKRAGRVIIKKGRTKISRRTRENKISYQWNFNKRPNSWRLNWRSYARWQR